MKQESTKPATGIPTRPSGASLAPLALALCLAMSSASSQAQHGHMNAGADAGNQLFWANGALFVTNSGYVQSMPVAASGTYAGYFNSGPTLTVLPATPANLGPVPNAPALGSFIEYTLTVFSAPAGGTFAFWEGGSLTPTYSLGAGMTSPLIPLSDAAAGAGTTGADPYGHLHGRRFTATTGGDYLIGLQLFETSGSGPGGGPAHLDSGMFYLQFSAVPEPNVGALLILGLLALIWCRRVVHPRNGSAKG